MIGGLTQRQRDAYNFIKGYIEEHGGVSPSYQEIRDGLKLHSKSGVYRIVYALRERQLIGFLNKRGRSIHLTERYCKKCGALIEF